MQPMKSLSMQAAALIFAMALLPISANAAGCLKGAAVGGVAGHAAGHHGLLGAGAGCAIGHHHASKRVRTMQGNTGSSNTGANAATGGKSGQSR
jgi:hypothetical protein